MCVGTFHTPTHIFLHLLLCAAAIILAIFFPLMLLFFSCYGIFFSLLYYCIFSHFILYHKSMNRIKARNVSCHRRSWYTVITGKRSSQSPERGEWTMDLSLIMFYMCLWCAGSLAAAATCSHLQVGSGIAHTLSF